MDQDGRTGDVGRHRRRRGPAVAALAATLLLGAVIALLASGDRQRGGGEQASAPGGHGAAAAEIRTVLVGSSDRADISAPGGPVITRLVSGRVPAKTDAVVLSDEDCVPDRKGVSHCLNRLRLADGSTVAVRHNHRMSEVPCLSPGERVQVRSA